MKLPEITIALLMAICIAAPAVFEAPSSDAAASGMGDIPPAIGPGQSSLFGEPGMASGGGYRRSFNHSDFDLISGWFSWTDESVGRIRLAVDAFPGGDYSSETKIGLGYSRSVLDDIHTSLTLAAAGNIYSLSYGQSLSGQDLGSASGLSLDLAAEATVYDRTSFRVLAENLTATNLGAVSDVEIPRSVTAAIGYSPYTMTDMQFYIRRETGSDFTYGLGISASPHEIIIFRLGAATNPDRVTGGLGLRYKFFVFDYALKSHPVLPLSHTISLGIDLAR